MFTAWTDLTDLETTLRTFDRLQRRVGWAFEPFGSLEPARTSERLARKPPRPAWPATNVLETKEAFLVKAEVPGLAEGDVSVSVEEDFLLVRGERKCAVPEGYRAHLRERASVAFSRKIPLPARVDADNVSATLTDGVLTITLPKAREALPRQIAVKLG